MLENEEGKREVLKTVQQLLDSSKQMDLKQIVGSAKISIDESGYDNWNGGIYFYTVTLMIPPQQFVKIENQLPNYEKELLSNFQAVVRHISNEDISEIVIVPISDSRIDWSAVTTFTTKEKLIEDINYLKNTMITVATGGPKVVSVNDEYKRRYAKVSKALKSLNLRNPNTYEDLFQWHGKWKSGEMQTYLERRTFIGNIFNDLINLLHESEDSELINITVNLEGWDRIERSVNHVKALIGDAKNEEQFQAIGLLCRDTIISLAQAVYKLEKHPTLDGVKPSKTDSNRMLAAYIAVELEGSSNETVRKYARITNDLANELAHKRTATKRDANICVSATLTLINLIGILEDRI